MAKKEYCVTIPIAGSISIVVKANDEEEAKAKAWDKVNDEGQDAGDLEWEFFEQLTEGNVLHAPVNEVDVIEL